MVEFPTPWSADEALRYDEFAENSFSWRYIEQPCMQALIQDLIHHDTKVLDLGCGGGRILRMLKLMGVPDEALIGLDNDTTLLARAREKHPQINLIQEELTEVPYRRVPGGINLVTAH